MTVPASMSSVRPAQELPALDDMCWLADYPSLGASLHPDKPALIGDSGSLDYAELEQASAGFAAYLEGLGLKPGARVIYCGKNSELFFPVLFGGIRSGVVIVPVNWRSVGAELAYLVKDAQASLLIHDAEFSSLVSEALAGLVAPPPCLLTNNLRETFTGTRQSSWRWQDAGDLCAVQLYTSGTTGRPKGVMLSHRALSIGRHLELGSPEWQGWGEQDVLLSAMPSFHVGGLVWMLIGLQHRMTCIISADPAPANILALIQRYQVTRTFVVPTVANALHELVVVSQQPAPRLKTLFYGAAVMDADLLTRCMQTFDCQFGQYFGMTETCGPVTFLPPSGHDLTQPKRLRSVGRVLPGMVLEIRDPDGRACEVGVAGEVWIHSPLLMLGYWNQPEATAEVIFDGWYRSGDGGYVDDEGYLFLTDRIKDMIISGAENVYPAEVEQALRRHPAVADVVVVGEADAHWGEAVTAVVEWRAGAQDSLEALREVAAQYIAAYKLPKRLYTMATLPRTTTGKLQRAAVRAFLRDSRAD